MTSDKGMRTQFSLGDRVSDPVVEVMKEFLDRVSRVLNAGGGG